MSDTAHEIFIDQSEITGTWRWHCETCSWTGWGCPSQEFAIAEHTSTAADIARRHHQPERSDV